MVKRVLFCLFLLSAVSAFVLGQAPPSWINGSARDVSFPSETFFTGYTQGNVRAGESVDAAKQRLLRDAQGLLAESIRMTVRSQTASQTVSTRTDRAERIDAVVDASVETVADAEIVGINSEQPYHDAQTGIIHAFAWVNKAEMATYYRRQIDMALSRVETAISVAEELVTARRRMNARRTVSDARSIFGELDAFRDMLITVDPRSDENSLQVQRSSNLMRTVERMLVELQQSTFVYLTCQHELRGGNDDAFSTDPGILCNIIAQALSENECAITTDREEADFEITLITSTSFRGVARLRDSEFVIYYANVRGTLYDRATQRRTAEFILINDPDAYAQGRSPEDAATRAFRKTELKDKVLESILPRIKN